MTPNLCPVTIRVPKDATQASRPSGIIFFGLEKRTISVMKGGKIPGKKNRLKRGDTEGQPSQGTMGMEEPGASQRSAADDPSGIAQEISGEKEKPITNQDEQEVITNEGETLDGVNDRP